tara:strand:- start:5324 stop:5524 length:201 start_codon:yes stop_codon:yes gene_type:complete
MLKVNKVNKVAKEQRFRVTKWQSGKVAKWQSCRGSKVSKLQSECHCEGSMTVAIFTFLVTWSQSKQ